ncbi:hypothetical protein Tsubulata_006571 [Turnera subulata]|uniref:LNS2/PITP domain-containing protein n=1 Tax=Turnera subulata TaxID=218843 RepID=A0A9Q0FUF6_9ROSI|nr:hypothetical protein Tsubulata_006571 [Turnera subulata]
MYAVGRIGSYITRGVYTVSGPFHPFGGAVDIVVVEQPDGSFKSSPWYVRFGKFQGVLKAKEKVVRINVNGVDADFHMYLDERGEAYFLREEDGEFLLSLSPPSDEASREDMRPKKCKSCNYDAKEAAMADQERARNGRTTPPRGSSRRTRSLGFIFGRRSIKQVSSGEGDDGTEMSRISSLDRAEMAADLLEVKWSTNLDSTPRRYDASNFSASDKHGDEDDHMRKLDEESGVESSVHGTAGAAIADDNMLPGENGSCDVERGNGSRSASGSPGSVVEETSVELLNLGTAEQAPGISGVGEGILEGESQVASEMSRTTDKPRLHHDDLDGNIDGPISELCSPDSQTPNVVGAYDKVGNEKTSGGRVDPSLATSVSDELTQPDNVDSFVYCETSERSITGLDCSIEQTRETLYVTNGVSAQVQVCAETLHATVEPVAEGTDHEAQRIVLEARVDICESSSQQTNLSPSHAHGHDEMRLEDPVITSESCTYIANGDPSLTSAVEVASDSICSIPTFSNTDHQIQDENNIVDRIIGDELQPSLNISDNQEQLYGSCGLRDVPNISVSESSEEEQFHFSDLDDFKREEPRRESNYIDDVDRENCPSSFLEGSREVNEPTREEHHLFPEQLDEKNQNPVLDNLKKSSSIPSSPIGIRKVHNVDAEAVRMAESLPTWSDIENLETNKVWHPLSHSLDSNSKPLEWAFQIEDESNSVDLDAAIEKQSPHKHLNGGDTCNSEDVENVVINPAVGNPSEAVVASGGSWKLWPFSFKRSKSVTSVQAAPNDAIRSDTENASDKSTSVISEQAAPNDAIRSDAENASDKSKSVISEQEAPNDAIRSDAENASDNNVGMEGNEIVVKPKFTEHTIKAKTPTSEQLASLNLMEGKNVVTFTFSTSMLGKQEVDARIFLWKWNTRIVISDVDGTITKSDVLGQFMPLVGYDWSQTGVTHLFSAIKENGYELLFLSARSISQAYITRQFLVNLKQDGKALPEGPVVISPDGLFPSLFREVIRRAPHEFKIACLEDIKVLFPPDCNPFYAGFGNRDTDEISYLKVGIPKGKIFIINPKGEVAVHRRVDTKSYTSLHELVHDMFPPSQSFEQVN